MDWLVGTLVTGVVIEENMESVQFNSIFIDWIDFYLEGQELAYLDLSLNTQDEATLETLHRE